MKTLTKEEHIALLTGQHVSLYPYDRRYMPPETLYTLWQILREEGADKKVFWNSSPTAGTQDTAGDLVSFVKMFSPEPPTIRKLWIAMSTEDPTQIAGAFWLDDFYHGIRASVSVFYRRRFWGKVAREGGFLACRYAFEALEIPSLWCYTPWKTAQHHAESVGFRLIARLPKFVSVAGTPSDLLVMRLLPEDLHPWQEEHPNG